MKVLRTTLLFLFASACLGAPGVARQAPEAPSLELAAADAMMLKLRDGRILWGRLAEHDEETLTFERLDNGGRVHLPWQLLDPDLDHALRQRFGYLEPQGEEILVAAERIPVASGEDVVGVIVNRTSEALWVKTAGGTLPLPLTRIVGASTPVQVPALEVYTRDELYRRKLSELGDVLAGSGAPAAEGHFAVAAFCERILDFQNALAHYEVGAQLAPTLRAAEVRSALARLEEKAAHQEQWEFLKDADLMRARRYYARALERLALFPEMYPGSPVLADWERLQAKTLKGQERALREEVVRRWHYWVERHAQDAAREMNYEAAVDWVESQMSEDVVASVRDDVDEIAPGIDTGAVRALWDAREGGRLRKASYGHGTWLLGEDRAHAELGTGDDEAEAPGSETESLREDLRERMRRYVESQRMSARRQQQSESDQPEEFWSNSSTNSRRQWMVAYYAEFVGDMRVARVRKSNCRECGGTGAKEIVYLGSPKTQDSRNRTSASGHRLIECPTCRHVGIVRRIQYR